MEVLEKNRGVMNEIKATAGEMITCMKYNGRTTEAAVLFYLVMTITDRLDLSEPLEPLLNVVDKLSRRYQRGNVESEAFISKMRQGYNRLYGLIELVMVENN